MILKTKDENFIKKNHSYEIPEIVSINASTVSKFYLGWLNQQTK